MRIWDIEEVQVHYSSRNIWVRLNREGRKMGKKMAYWKLCQFKTNAAQLRRERFLLMASMSAKSEASCEKQGVGQS